MMLLCAVPLSAQPPGTWSPKGNLSQARTGHTATVLANGKVLIVGGKDVNGQAMPTAELYDPATGLYSLVPTNLPVPVSGHTATLLLNGNVLIVGGKAESGTPIPYAQVFDTASNTFAGPVILSVPRSEHTATSLKDGRVIIAGGTDGSIALSTIEIYDSLAAGFSLSPISLSVARQRHTATLLDDGTNGDTGTMAPTGSLIMTRSGHSAALLLDGTVLVAGGKNALGQNLNSAEIYTPTANAFSLVTATMSIPRSGHTGAQLQDNGRVLIVGGTNGGQLVTTAEVYDPVSQAFLAVGSPAVGRQLFGSNFFGVPYTGGMLASGGQGANDLALASSELFSYPTLRTDKQDYPPGYTVRMIGEGWQPNEMIDILVHENNGDPDLTMTITADATGAFSFDAFQTDLGDLNMTFLATASGPVSNWTAQAKFTDAKPNTVTLNPTTASVNAGTASTVNYTVTVNFNGNGNSCTSPLSISPAVPAGWTATFTPASLTSTGGDATSTLKIVTSAATAPLTYAFTVTAGNGGGTCQSGTATSNVVTSLIVLGAANHVAFVPQPTNAVSTAVISPAVTVQVLDANNNVVTSSSAPITVAIGSNPGGGTLAGTVTQNAVNGVATFNNLSINKVGTGYTLTANSSGLTGTTSSAFNITVGAAAKLRVETAVDGSGIVVPPQSVTSGSSITVFSIRRDAGDNFIDNVALASMSDWSLVSITGGVVAGDLNPAGNKRSAVFTGNAAGSAAIHATLAGLASVDSGTLTVPNVATTLALNSVSPNSVSYGSTGPVTFTATLTRTTGGAAVVGATVNFTVDGVAAGSGITNGSGVATFTTYNPSSLSVSGHNVQASFVAATISGPSYLSSTSGTLSLTVTKATPMITWANPADITYGTALSGTQLNATASVPGSFVYTPAAGAILNAGAGQTLHVAFSPTDTTNYNNPTKDVLINVTKANAVIVVTPYSVTYNGVAHTATGTASGVESPTPVSLTSLLDLSGTTHTNAGTYATDAWTFAGNSNYNATSGTVSDSITK
ncbi:MAG: hypothetical protein E6K60_04490, partial [Nitrospirae bacterium]